MAEEFENQNGEQTDPEQQQPEEKTFTQAEVDAIINKRLAKERKGQPSAEELTAFRAWKAQQEPEQKGPTQSDLDSALADMEMTRRENWLLRKGIDPEEVDYYVYRISKEMDGETDFEDAAEEYFKKHKQRQTVRMDTGARLNSNRGSKSINDTMNDLIRNAK